MRAERRRSWLQVTATSAPGDPRRRPATLGPTWGYHLDDVNLALGNLVPTWPRRGLLPLSRSAPGNWRWELSPGGLDSPDGQSRRRRQPEGRRGEDHDRAVPGRGHGPAGAPSPAGGPRPAGLPDLLLGLRSDGLDASLHDVLVRRPSLADVVKPVPDVAGPRLWCRRPSTWPAPRCTCSAGPVASMSWRRPAAGPRRLRRRPDRLPALARRAHDQRPDRGRGGHRAAAVRGAQPPGVGQLLETIEDVRSSPTRSCACSV